jgi:hypothetical protein
MKFRKMLVSKMLEIEGSDFSELRGKNVLVIKDLVKSLQYSPLNYSDLIMGCPSP